MKALLCEHYGEPEELQLRDVPLPEPGSGQVRLRVAATGVNFPDGLIVRNLYQIQPQLPFSPGGEVSGTIDALGEGVTDWAVGDRVAAMTLHGGMAEGVLVEAKRLVALHDTMPFDIAAVFIMAYATALHALKQRAMLQPGETLLVLGAAGGVGLAAVEVGKAMGARVIAAASSADKLDLAKAHGADACINYAEENLRDAVRALTGGDGPNVIYDPVGGDLAEPAFRSIAPDGRYLVVGFAGGAIPSLPFNIPLLKSASIVGVFWGAFTTREPAAQRDNMAQLFRWYGEGRLRPAIDRRFPLTEGGAAIRYLMDRKARGKVVVEVS